MTVEYCELCGRKVTLLTRHHLIPRTRHHNKRIRRIFSREQMQKMILWLCIPCHSQVHTMIDEKQLALHFYSRERLLSHPELRRFVKWIAKKPADFRVSGTSWKRR